MRRSGKGSPPGTTTKVTAGQRAGGWEPTSRPSGHRIADARRMRAGVVLRPQGRLFGAFGASPTSKLVQAGFGVNCCPEGCAETSSVELRAGQAGMAGFGQRPARERRGIFPGFGASAGSPRRVTAATSISRSAVLDVKLGGNALDHRREAPLLGSRPTSPGSPALTRRLDGPAPHSTQPRRSPHFALWRDGVMPADPSLNSIQTLGFVSLDQRLKRLQRVFEVGQLSGVFHCSGV
jgi:hypothetical protein